MRDPFIVEFEENLPKLRRLSKFLGGAEADDLFQDTCERLLKYRSNYTLGTNFMGWDYHVMRSRLIATARKNKVRSSTVSLTDIYPDVPCDGAQIATVQLSEVARWLRKVKIDNRETLLLSVLGFKLEEIADLMKVNSGTVKSRISRSRAQLSSYRTA